MKSSIFGWGVSLMSVTIFNYLNAFESLENFLSLSSQCLVCYMLYVVIRLGNLILPVILNCVLFIILVFCLCCHFNSSAHTSCNLWHRLYVAISIFILSDVLLLYDVFIQYVFDCEQTVNFFLTYLSLLIHFY